MHGVGGIVENILLFVVTSSFKPYISLNDKITYLPTWKKTLQTI